VRFKKKDDHVIISILGAVRTGKLRGRTGYDAYCLAKINFADGYFTLTHQFQYYDKGLLIHS
jgi:hypothetical protein